MLGLKRENEAVEAFGAALKLDPNNAQLKAGLEEALLAARKSSQASSQASSQSTIFTFFRMLLSM